MSLFSAPFLACRSEERVPRWYEGVATRCFGLETYLSRLSRLGLKAHQRRHKCSTYDTSEFFLFLGHRLHDHLVLASSPLNGPSGSTPGRSRGSSPHNAGHFFQVGSQTQPHNISTHVSRRGSGSCLAESQWGRGEDGRSVQIKHPQVGEFEVMTSSRRSDTF